MFRLIINKMISHKFPLVYNFHNITKEFLFGFFLNDKNRKIFQTINCTRKIFAEKKFEGFAT